jgi:methyltransferase-like protein 22
LITQQDILFLEHKKSTVLSEVGLQVWRGAFLLNDFVLSNRELFSNKNVIELGSGVGLTSILASIVAKKVICTGKWKTIERRFF